MDEDYINLVENLNIIKKLDNDSKAKSIALECFFNGLEIGSSFHNLDILKIFKYFKLNV